MVGVDAAVEHADEDVAGAVGDLVGLVGLDHRACPTARPRAGRSAAAGVVVGLEVAVDGLLGALLVAGRAAAPGRPGGLGRALGDGDGAGGADGLDGVAALRDDVGAEGRDLRVRDDDADLRPRLDDDAAGGLDGRLDEAGLAGVGDAGVDDVAHEQAVGGVDGDRRRDRLGGGASVEATATPPMAAVEARASDATATMPRLVRLGCRMCELPWCEGQCRRPDRAHPTSSADSGRSARREGDRQAGSDPD